MRLDRLTNKFQLALADAQSLALGHDNQFIEPLHLMSALLNQEGGSVSPLLTSAGINAGQLRTDINQALNRLPQVEVGLPLATEALDPNSPQYLGDLFSWSAIGARTTESQTHREMASGLSMPVGFKNGTDGSLATAINAMRAAAQPHRFVGINQAGQVALLQTQGNPDGHVILRGGKAPNYSPADVAQCEKEMEQAGLRPSLMVDCSHGNSNKDYRRQPAVAESVVAQIKDGNRSIIGLMIESNIHEGNQSSEQPRSEMKYGVSVTDACISWEMTDALLREIHQDLNGQLTARVA
ncbi:3-deoxy-7-phosphoheptulonate synthase [Escherichia coli]